MELFHFKDYRHFVTFRLGAEGGAWGTMSELAKAMKIRISHLSQVLKGTRNLSHEQAHFLSLAFQLTELETQYLNEMINLERAGSPEYKKRIQQRMQTLNDARSSTFLPERNQAIFYSSWIYAGVQLATGIPNLGTPEKIAKHLGLSEETVQHALQILVEIDLCATDGKRYFPTAKKTTVDERSPLYGRHKANWRMKALEQIPKFRPGDLFFSAAVRIDRKSYEKIMKMLEKAIAETHHSIEHADDEILACLNLDWFEF